MKSNKFIGIVMLVLLSLVSVNAGNIDFGEDDGSTVLQQVGRLATNARVAQGLTPIQDITLEDVVLNIAEYNTLTDNYYLRLVSDNGGEPSNTLYQSGSYAIIEPTDISATYINLTFTEFDGIIIPDSTKVWFVLSRDDNTTDTGATALRLDDNSPNYDSNNKVMVYDTGVWVDSATANAQIVMDISYRETLEINLQDYYNTENISIDINFSVSSNATFDMGFYLTKLLGEDSSIANGITRVSDKITLSSTYDDGIVAYYPLTTDSLDYSGNGYDGTEYNGVVASGTEYQFDGVDDSIGISISSLNVFSIGYWANIDSSQDSTHRVSIIGDSPENDNYIGFKIDSFDYFGEFSDGTAFSTDSNILTYDTYDYIFFTYDGDTYTWYKNGVLVRAVSGIVGKSMSFSSIATGYGPYFFNGSIADVRIYNRSLSSTEISNLYNESRKSLGLVLDLPLRDTEEDYSPADNAITLYNGVVINESGAHFDGVDDYMIRNSFNDISKNNDFTISFYVYPNNVASDITSVLVNDNGGSDRVGFSYRDTDNLNFGIYDGSTYLNDARQKVDIDLQQWNYITLVYNSGIATLYKNGVDAGFNTGQPILSSNNKFSLSASGTPDRYFNGSIKDVKIYNRALSESEIIDLYNQNNFKESTATYEFTFDLSDYDDRSYCEVDGTLLDFNEGGSYELYVDGTRRYLDTFFAYGGDTSLDVEITLNNGDYDKSIEINSLSVYCGVEPNYQTEYIVWDNSSTSGTLSLFNLTEGSHELNLYLEADTDNFNYSYSFITDYTDPILTQLSTYQEGYKFYFYDTFDITELYIDTCYYQTRGVNKSCSDTQYYTSNGDYNINVSLVDLAGNSYSNTDYPLTINASYSFVELNTYTLNLTDFCFNTSTCTYLGNNTNHTVGELDFTTVGEKYWHRQYLNNTVSENVTLWVNPYIYIYFDRYNGTAITDFYIDYVNYTDSYYFKIYDLGLGEQSVQFRKIGFETLDINFTLTTTSTNFTFNISNSLIKVNIYDRLTESLITDNVSIVLIGTYGYNATTDTGTMNISSTLFINETYTIIASSDNYNSESVYFEFDNREILQLDIYMLSSNQTNLGTHTVKAITDTGLLVNSAVCSALEWKPSLSAFVTVAQGLTDSTGETTLNVELGTKLYQFKCTKGSSSSTSGNKIIGSSGLTTTLQLATTIITPANLFKTLTYSLTNESVNSTHQRIIFSFDDSSGVVDTGCLKIYKVLGTKFTELQSSCVSSSSSEIQLIQDINQTYTIRAVASINIDGATTNIGYIEFESEGSISKALKDYGLDIILPLVFLFIGFSIGFLLVPQNIYISIIGSIVMVWLSVAIVTSVISSVIASFSTIVLGLMFWGGYKFK